MPGAPSRAIARARQNSAFGPPTPSPPARHGALAARQEQERPVGASPGLAGQPRLVEGERARLALEGVAEQAHGAARGLCRGGCCRQRLGRGGDHAVLGSGEAGRVGPEHAGRSGEDRVDRGGHRDGPAREDRARVCWRRGVSHRGTGGDERGVIPGNVRYHQRKHPGGPGGRGELPPLHSAEVLPHDVHLADRCARGEERIVDGLLLGEADGAGRLHQKRRAAARDQRDHEVVRSEADDQLQHPRRSLEAASVGHRMRRLDDLDALRRATVAVARDDKSLARAPDRLKGFGHAGRCLARSDHDDPAGGLRWQCPGHAPHRIGGGDGGFEERAQEAARVWEGHVGDR